MPTKAIHWATWLLGFVIFGVGLVLALSIAVTLPNGWLIWLAPVGGIFLIGLIAYIERPRGRGV